MNLALLIRRVIAGVFIVGIAGMIAANIMDRPGPAVTVGLITATAALNLIVLTATGSNRSGPETPVRFDEETAASVERQIVALVDAGADEDALRDIVRRAVAMGADAARRGDAPGEG